jgi:D-glycero-D-manno-heptose 1,7-bisphosphate phosphatase
MKDEGYIRLVVNLIAYRRKNQITLSIIKENSLIQKQQRLIILDRDGVINIESKAYIKSPDEWIPIPGSLNAIANLSAAEFTIVIATNQSGINRGFYTVQTLNAIHQKMLTAVHKAGGHIAKIFYCPHKPEDGCDCRKPLPGMFLQIGRELQLSLKNTPCIGDSYRDLQAAQSVDARPILVKTGNGLKTLTEFPQLANEIEVFDDLAAAASFLIEKKKNQL